MGIVPRTFAHARRESVWVETQLWGSKLYIDDSSIEHGFIKAMKIQVDVDLAVGKALDWDLDGFKPHWGQFIDDFFFGCTGLSDNLTVTPIAQGFKNCSTSPQAGTPWDLRWFTIMPTRIRTREVLPPLPPERTWDQRPGNTLPGKISMFVSIWRNGEIYLFSEDHTRFWTHIAWKCANFWLMWVLWEINCVRNLSFFIKFPRKLIEISSHCKIRCI